jgi:hypothetical protein
LSEPLGRSLVPPRPNLGPEPWPETSPLARVWLPLLGLILAVAAWFLWRTVRRRYARSHEGPAAPDALDVTPRGRLVALSTSAKSALATRFGPAWRAKTTEELAVQPALGELLGPEMLQELIEFLDRIDRLKFAPERPNHTGQSLDQELAAWNPRVAGLIGRIGARDGGRHDRQASRVDSALSPGR